ncbi:MAG: nucleotidyltransferase [Holophagae bacterium]
MKKLLELFREFKVQYALVGGHAVNYYGYVRTTQDMDLLVLPTTENAERIMDALSVFGFGGAGIPQGLFERDHGAAHLGVEPNRIDILTSLKGVENSTIFERTHVVEIDGVSVNIISLEDLLAVKRSSDRPRDLADADELAKING